MGTQGRTNYLILKANRESRASKIEEKQVGVYGFVSYFLPPMMKRKKNSSHIIYIKDSINLNFVSGEHEHVKYNILLIVIIANLGL